MQQKDDSAGPFEGLMQDYEARRAAALAMGGPEKLARRAKAGVLNARERIERLCDEGSFLESGLFGTSASNWSDREKTPTDGKVAGFGKIDARPVAVAANDDVLVGQFAAGQVDEHVHGRRVGLEMRLHVHADADCECIGSAAWWGVSWAHA